MRNKVVTRKVHKIDAAGQSAGRLATKAAILLMGKNKVEYMPNIDIGDYVEVSNVRELNFTGKKLSQKKYYSYSGYPGGLKEEKLDKLFKEKPEEVVHKAIYNMLPKNKLRRNFIKRLKFI